MIDESVPAPKERKPPVFYPVLFAIFPVLSIYSANLALVPGSAIVRPFLFVLGCAIALWALLALCLRSLDRGALTASFIATMCFAYTRIIKTMNFPYYVRDLGPEIWLSVLVVGSILVAWKGTGARKLFNLLSAMLVVSALGQTGYGLFRSFALRPLIQKNANDSGSMSSTRPDIIYIILDGYGRSDALQRAMGYSSDAFVEGLEKRGFYVAKDSHANYCQTEISVASSLNMDFIPELLPHVTRKEGNRSPLDTLIDQNQVASYLRQRGYSYSAITTGFPPLQFNSADVNLRSQFGLNLIESALIQQTPFETVSHADTSMFEERRLALQAAYSSLESLTSKVLNPRFTIVHILAPHPPFVFEADGSPRSHHGTFGLFDGSDYIFNANSAKDYRDGYVGQAEYIGNRTLQALDVLLAGSGPKPVNLVQGDHGSKLRLNQEFASKTDMNECFPNLSAYYVPDSVRKNLYPGITPVNSFRVLFNGLFDDKRQLKPDRSFYSPFPTPYEFTEVTNQLADHTKMAAVPLPK